uniref:SCAN box domain-containing protein n=1 Tax=Pygocentrus nattereri TaxID=42514 RepID=A0AAR2LWF9_PYGNA
MSLVKRDWAIRLVPLLTGKARSAYVAMDISYTNDYKKVKEVILKKYEISAETYRQRFRATDIWPDETPRELYVRLKELFAKWTKPEEHTVQQMSEILILEQFMRLDRIWLWSGYGQARTEFCSAIHTKFLLHFVELQLDAGRILSSHN